MKRTAINLFIESAPVDPFDDESAQQFQVVAVDREAGAVYVLTDRHFDRERAMDQLRRSIAVSATRHELAMDYRAVTGRLDRLDERVTALYRWASQVRSGLVAIVSAVNDNASRLKGGGATVGIDIDLRDPHDPEREARHAMASAMEPVDGCAVAPWLADRYEPGKHPRG